MDYNHITNFLEKFRKILSQGEGINKTILEIITKYTQYPIELSMIKTKGTLIYIQSSPMLRSEILIHKEAILIDLAKSIPGRNFSDIR